MDAIIQRILIANGIFRSRDSNHLRCSICITQPIFVDWKKHIGKSVHIGMLQHFKLAFSLNNERIQCKKCKANFHWIMLEAHAKLHEIVPWYVPPDRYKTFYENHILQWDKQFYCYPCDMFFPEWSSAFAHTDNERHKILVKMEVPSNDLSSWNQVDIPYELLVNEGFVTWGLTTFKCTICNRSKIGLNHISQHINGAQHKYMKVSFICELRDWKNRKMNSPIANEPEKVQTLPCIYVIQNDSSLYNCKICNIELVDQSSVDNHVNGMTHANALKKHGCVNISVKGNDYHCRCCDCLILGIANVFLHIKGTRHKNNLTMLETRKGEEITMNQLPVKRESVKQLQNEPDCLSSDYIVMLGNDKFCKICNCTIDDFDSAHHIAGEEHLNSVKQFRKNVTMTENFTEYHCKRCDCRILGVDNLFLHLNGNKHANSINKVEHQEEVEPNDDEIKTTSHIEIDVEEIPEVEKNSSKLVVDLCYDHIFKIDDNDSCCKICNCKIPQSEIDAHITGNEHDIAVQEFHSSVRLMKNDKYRCKSCNCTIRGIDNVYIHIHGNRHRKDKAEYPGEQENPQFIEKIEKSTELNEKDSKPDEKRNSDESLNEIPKNERNKISDEIIVHNDNVADVSETVDKNNDGKKKEEIGDNSSKIDNGLLVNGMSHDNYMNNINPKYESLNLGSVMALTLESDPEKLSYSMIENINGRKQILLSESNTQRVVQLLDFHKDYIHSMRDKLKEVELGMKLCLANDANKIYCLICHEEVPKKLDTYFEHLWTLEHCEYLEEMEKDHDLFELVPGQLSELDLASHYMDETSEDTIICHVCNTEMDNVTYTLRDHINDKRHVQKRKEMHSRARQNFEAIKSRIQCDWYKIYNYHCVLCSKSFESELTFVKHLKSTKHEGIVKNLENDKRGLIYDFCEPCGLLWYGKRCAYANHCETSVHKTVIMRDGEEKSIACLVPKLVQYIRYAIKHFDKPSSGARKKKRRKMIRDVESGLSIENEKIIKFFNDCFSLCGKLLQFLEQWLIICDLSGSERITIYALYWYMIFFLQTESAVPSVLTLKEKIDELPMIAGLKTGESPTVTHKEAQENINIEDFFIRFFTFYANFDFRCDVLSPLLGKVIKKQAFAHPENFPKEMDSHIVYMENSNYSETFQFDSPMCLQDPFDLCSNLTKSVSKVELQRFRMCCTHSLNALRVDL